MTKFLKAIYILIASALAILLMPGCTDEPIYQEESIPDGDGLATLNLTFTPSVNVNLTSRSSIASGGTDGDAIKDIENIFIAVYDLDGNLQKTLYYTESASNVTVKEVARENGNPVSTSETSTMQAVVTGVPLSYGRYHIYAVANMGDLSSDSYYSSQLNKEADFRAIRFAWNEDNVKLNYQMSGYFSNSENYPTYYDSNSGITAYQNQPEEVIFSPARNTLHAWLRRAASKVTVDYDASGLNENIYIHIKSVTIYDIPSSCSLVDDNKPAGNDATVQVKGQAIKDLIDKGQTITYGTYDKGNNDNDFTYVLSKGHPKLGNAADADSEATAVEDLHSNSSPSLFFFENMQGAGSDMPDKRQDADSDGFLDDAGSKNPGDNGWKDDVAGGTYVEVLAYYVSSADNNHGEGPIKYRFMLGKNVTNDYNAERNHHYKLTLKFRGNANDIDWHIDYDEEDRPGIYTPIFYVSYRYNEPDDVLTPNGSSAYWDKCYPIRLAGDQIGETVTVRIVENNWGTRQGEKVGESPNEYDNDNVWTYNTSAPSNSSAVKPKLNTSVLHSGVWHGFLSLYQQEGEASIGIGSEEWQRYSAGEYLYWYSRGQKPYYQTISYYASHQTIKYPSSNYKQNCEDPEQNDELNYGEGYREYSTTPGIHSDEFGNYKVEVSYRNGIKETTLYIPLYTRPLIINQKKGFTGNNPYFSYQRYAKLRIDAEINGSNQIHYADVYQVRRIINPKGVFRAYGNEAKFTVSLAHRYSEDESVNFTAFRSIGPWRARIIGTGWTTIGSTSGGSGSYINVVVKPTGLSSEDQVNNAMLLIEYHDYKCVHYVHLRQGYAPQRIYDGDNAAYWHTFNVSYVENADDETAAEAHMTHGPLDPGAMYRYGNLSDPIDLINNTRNMRDLTGTAMYAIPSKGFFIGPVGTNEKITRFKTWDNISTSTTWPYTTMNTYDTVNVKVRLPEYEDFNRLRGGSRSSQVDYAYGICYGDGATGIDYNATTAFYYSRYNHHGLPDWIKELKYDAYGNDINSKLAPYEGSDPHGRSGIRGCFIYNKETKNVVFFPMGVGSFGRRKSVGGDGGKIYGGGALHYADFDANWITAMGEKQAHYVPVLYNLYSNYGACYWIGTQYNISTDAKDTTGTSGDNDKVVVAWDFNYSTIDFNPIYRHNMHTRESVGGDACFLRLVQDTPPTVEQCKAMTYRVDLYRTDDDNITGSFWDLYDKQTDQ